MKPPQPRGRMALPELLVCAFDFQRRFRQWAEPAAFESSGERHTMHPNTKRLALALLAATGAGEALAAQPAHPAIARAHDLIPANAAAVRASTNDRFIARDV